MTKEEAKKIFLNRGYIEVPGGSYYDADKWRESITVISKWLEQQPCEDCISREATVKRLCKVADFMNEKRSGLGSPYIMAALFIQDNKDEFPPVTPKEKTGKWIRTTDKSGHLVWECNKCGWQQRFNTNFCPNCGARMVSE